MKHKDGHHGGAWKVAYADFVTAMMALFLVLWLTAQDEKIKEAVERAFRHPFSSMTKESVGIIPSKEKSAEQDQRGAKENSSMIEMAMLRRLSQDLLKSLLPNEEDLSENPLEIELTPEGLRISIFDRADRPIFGAQSVQFTSYGDWVFSTLAWELSRYRTFTIELEGHTELGHPPVSETYGNWDLSTDRANAARRKLIDHGVSSPQVRKVAGFADTVPLPDRPPEDEANRRVTVMLKLASAKT